MKPAIQLRGNRPVQFSMRTITEEDIEVLRQWKNSHREFFFHKDLISPEQQTLWYRQFSEAADDHMFVIVVEATIIGCIGARLLNGCVDIYNVILGRKEYGRRGIMSSALKATCAFVGLLYSGRPIQVRVLKENSAIRWYEKNHFVLTLMQEDHVVMELGKAAPEYYECSANLAVRFGL